MSGTDPWIGMIERMQGRMMVAGQCSVEGPEDTAALMAEAEAAFLRQCLDAIDAARAAEAAQHQQEIADLKATNELALQVQRRVTRELACWRCGTAAFQPNERCDSHMSWTDRLQTEVEHHNAWRKRADGAEARLAAVEAERDAEVTAHERTIDELTGLADNMGRLIAERDRLNAALRQAAQDLETVGNDYPGSSCWQWCAGRAAVARAALTPQESTDGETR